MAKSLKVNTDQIEDQTQRQNTNLIQTILNIPPERLRVSFLRWRQRSDIPELHVCCKNIDENIYDT